MDWESIKDEIQKAVQFALNPPQKGAFGVLPSPYTDEMLAEAERNREGVMLGEFNPKWRTKMNLYRQIKKESDLAKREALLGRREAHDKKYQNDFDKYDAYEKQFRDFDRELGTKQVEAAKEFLKPVGKERVPPTEIFIDDVGNPILGPVDWMNPMQKKSFDSTLSKQFGETPAEAGMRWDHIRMLLQRQAEEAAKKGGQ